MTEIIEKNRYNGQVGNCSVSVGRYNKNLSFTEVLSKLIQQMSSCALNVVCVACMLIIALIVKTVQKLFVYAFPPSVKLNYCSTVVYFSCLFVTDVGFLAAFDSI